MPTSLTETISQFNDAFSNQRLDDVMSFFADDCEFRELNGRVAKGKNGVRNAIARIFSGAYGRMTFLEERMLADESRKEICFAWRCQHDMNALIPEKAADRIAAAAVKALNGSVFHWEGMDYFILDDDYKIVSKRTYGKAALPKFRRGAADHTTS